MIRIISSETSRLPVEGKSSACLICMKYRIIILIIIIISLGQILVSYIAYTSRTHARAHARAHTRARAHTAVAAIQVERCSLAPNRDGPLRWHSQPVAVPFK